MQSLNAALPRVGQKSACRKREANAVAERLTARLQNVGIAHRRGIAC